MITATYNSTYHGSAHTEKVDHLVNRGEWFGKTWLIGIGMGFESTLLVIEADSESDAIDVLADSTYSHLIHGEVCGVCHENQKNTDYDYSDCYCDTAGNDSHPVNLDNVMICPCKVNYFAKADSLLL